ncbi:MAG: CARDB domain-containing protein [Ilumatobacter sp.]|uniref:CARDB domain-containing protein n=1 Tax=Ilumatobacter sp. TaxID=1967498 RepID=UPI003297002C
MRSEGTLAESVTLALCAAVLAVVVGVILFLGPDKDDPPAPVASTEAVEQVGDEFHVTVVVRNTGGRTAANVQVNAELVVDGETTAGDQTVDFLAPGNEASLAFVFADDPSSGDLTVGVSGFLNP